ncbi:hypothetical protein [Saccharopolyspora shandongensis]
MLQGPGGPEEDPSLGFDLGDWLVPRVDDGFNADGKEEFEAAR